MASGGNVLQDGDGNIFGKQIRLPVVSKTANYTFSDNDDCVVLVDATAGEVTITLPAASIEGNLVHVKKIDAGVNNVVVARAGADTIEGATSVTLNAQYESTTLCSDGGTAWYKLAGV